MYRVHSVGCMNITMNNVHIKSMENIITLLQTPHTIIITDASRKARYACITETLIGVTYRTLSKKERGIVKTFLVTVTGYTDRQVKRLIQKWSGKGGLVYVKRASVGAATRTYGPEDIALLIKTDILHKTPNGRSVQEILKREHGMFGHNEYATIAKISVSHIYNIRNHCEQYRSSDAMRYTKTNPTTVSIGERTKPRPEGKPGSIRVDSVHQGDRDGEKGVYHINLVDEVTQWEIVLCVESIADSFLIPLLEAALALFPFAVWNFHSDNGSEYINKQVASMLQRLLVHQTKSRPRHSNDNALPESKNASVIRKHMGRNHIPKKYAPDIQTYYLDHFNTYLNYHRICAYATDYTDKRGKVRKKYETYQTPYERLKSLPQAEQYLKSGVTFAELDKRAYAMSDNEYAEKLDKAKKLLAKKLQE
jgi:hypothetical protein